MSKATAKTTKQKARKSDISLAWHFCGETLRDGRGVPADGEWLVHEGECEMCETGLHASRRLIDALRYAPGSTICRVAIRGIADEHENDNDKLVARERMIIWRLVASDDVLHAFARKAALSVIHLWKAPDVVRKYLETGDEIIRDAARAASAASAARDAARAAGAAARAAWDAAWAAAWAARDAAWAARAAKLEEFNTLLEQMVTEAAGNPDTAKLLKAVR